MRTSGHLRLPHEEHAQERRGLAPHGLRMGRAPGWYGIIRDCGLAGSEAEPDRSHRPAATPPGKERIAIRLTAPLNRSGRRRILLGPCRHVRILGRHATRRDPGAGSRLRDRIENLLLSSGPTGPEVSEPPLQPSAFSRHVSNIVTSYPASWALIDNLSSRKNLPDERTIAAQPFLHFLRGQD